ncbi:hypothetical protein P3S67_032192 [Capsicum chacoense]
MMVKDSLLNEIVMLNHLRFLRIGTEVKSISMPSSFSNLWNLETLWVENNGSTWILLLGIWDLVKLRVLSMVACSFFDMDIYEPILIAEGSKLENLRFLETLVLSYSKVTEDIFIRFPNLQKLTLILKESWDYSTKRYWFPKLEYLIELDFLRVKFESSYTNDTRLPNLEELLLTRTIIQGEEWNMAEKDTFKNLKYLNLDEVTLTKWEVGEESFPVIEKLVLWKCHMLMEIPPSFGNICSLKIIKLVKSPQLEDSAKKIKQYIEDMGGDELQVLSLNNIPLFK